MRKGKRGRKLTLVKVKRTCSRKVEKGNIVRDGFVNLNKSKRDDVLAGKTLRLAKYTYKNVGQLVGGKLVPSRDGIGFEKLGHS